jgi:hypothetical protein
VQSHLARGDFRRWIEDVFDDRELGGAIQHLERGTSRAYEMPSCALSRTGTAGARHEGFPIAEAPRVLQS